MWLWWLLRDFADLGSDFCDFGKDDFNDFAKELYEFYESGMLSYDFADFGSDLCDLGKDDFNDLGKDLHDLVQTYHDPAGFA